ncbi:MAG: ATP phosphoribosyltransferase [bacterium]
MVLNLGLPKGSLQESTTKLFAKAGYRVNIRSRSYYPSIDDPEIRPMLIRAQEMPIYVNDGVLDCGLTGYDWVIEQDAEVEFAAELNYAKEGYRPVRWVLAVPNDSPVNSINDLQGKRISTELVNVTKKYLAKHGITAQIDFSWGATEVKPPMLADAIVELTETGNSLRANNLRIVETIMESTTRLIVNPKSWQDHWKRKKIENLACLLKGALLAESRVGLKMNVNKSDLDNVLRLLPAINTPTISALKDETWVDVDIVTEEAKVRELIPKLKEAGACGIVEYPLNKVIY